MYMHTYVHTHVQTYVQTYVCMHFRSSECIAGTNLGPQDTSLMKRVAALSTLPSEDPISEFSFNEYVHTYICSNMQHTQCTTDPVTTAESL